MTLKTYMERNGLCAADVVRGAHVPAPALSRFLNNKAYLSAKHVARIVRFTRGKVGIDELVPPDEEAEARP